MFSFLIVFFFLSITSLSLRCNASRYVWFVDCSNSSSIVEYTFLSYFQLLAEISWSLHERISDSVRWIVLFLSCSEMLLSDWSACYHPEHGRRRSFTHSWSRNNKRAVRGTCRDEAGVRRRRWAGNIQSTAGTGQDRGCRLRRWTTCVHVASGEQTDSCWWNCLLVCGSIQDSSATVLRIFAVICFIFFRVTQNNNFKMCN